MGKRTFTLAELAVVFLMVGLLAATVLAAQGRARETARRAACRAGLHEWYFGLEMFADSHQDQYPGSMTWDLHDMFSTRQEWEKTMHAAMVQYAEPGMMLCPSFEPGPNAPLTWIKKGTAPVGYWSMSSYWMFVGGATHNSYCDADMRPLPPRYGCIYNGTGDRHVMGRTMDLAPRTIMYMDRGWAREGSKACYEREFTLGTVSNHPIAGPEGLVEAAGKQQLRLAEGANALLIDGSVYWMDMTGEVHQYHRDQYRFFYVSDWVHSGL